MANSQTVFPDSGGQPHDSVIEKLAFRGESAHPVSNEVDQEAGSVPHLIDASKISAQAEVPKSRDGQVGIQDTRPTPWMPLDSKSAKVIVPKFDLDPKFAERVDLKTGSYAHSPGEGCQL